MQKQRSFFLSLIFAVVTINVGCSDDKRSPETSPISPKLAKKKISQTKNPEIGLREAEDIGVTDNEIHIGSWAPQSGPAKDWGGGSRGMDIFFSKWKKCSDI